MVTRTGHRWLFAIVLVAAVLRLFPIWFGLPYPEARPDEETAIAHAVAILGGDFNPHFFHWPSLTFYLFAAAYGVASLVRRLLSMDPALPTIEQVLIARVIVAAAGTATVIVLYRIGRRMADEATGLLAALLLAVSVLHVRDSHFAMTDIIMTLLVTVSLAALLRANDSAALRWFAAAGLAGGLAASTKYSAAALVAAMGAAQLTRFADGARPWHPRAWLPSLVFLAAFGGGFIIGTPYALLDRQTFMADFRFDFTHLSGGHADLILGRGWLYHLTHSLPYGAGLSIFVAGIAGLVPMLKSHTRHAIVLLVFGAAFYAAIGSGYTVFFRYILPLIPLACLSAGVAVRHLSRALAPTMRVSPAWATALLVAVVAGPALVSSTWLDCLLARTDTRVLAGDWLNDRILPGESLHDAGGSYTHLMVWKASNRWTYDAGSNAFNGDPSRTPDWLVLYQSPVPVYTSMPAGLRTLAATQYELVHTVHGTRDLSSLAMYDLQDAFFLPFSGFDTVERPGPTVLVYRRRDLPPVER